jgi:hypothetical protein
MGDVAWIYIVKNVVPGMDDILDDVARYVLLLNRFLFFP